MSRRTRILFFESGRRGGSVLRLRTLLECLDATRFEAGVVSYYGDHAAARLLGEHSLEFAAAGGMVLANAEIGDIEEAERWLARAADIAVEAPSALRARQLESWRGRVRCAAGDAATGQGGNRHRRGAGCQRPARHR